MSEDQSCGGGGLAEHTEHAVELDKDGDQVRVMRSWTGSCGACHGSGQGWEVNPVGPGWGAGPSTGSVGLRRPEADAVDSGS
ncbi:hypothetical protein [Streptomyces griseofuscus]|uniref:hypothetical protein n=1 Tax=Streptomyces griseofuscus TaxID=146922 RepID=UPI00342FE3EF